jgi:hypothetical protein
MFRDVLSDVEPITLKFKTIQGTAYRLLSRGGELYILTSKAMYALGKLASRFLAGEFYPRAVTQILTMPMEAIDANLAGDNWLLVVMPDEVRRFDTAWIHDNIPQDDSEEAQDFHSASVKSDWHWEEMERTPRHLEVAVCG